VLGVTGSPGTGKSTLTDRLIAHYRRAGKTVGVLAVDPSSPFTGGAILGDRIRMTGHAGDADVFIRSMGSRGHLGGLASHMAEAVQVLDAAGKDVIIVETVGVGQAEIEIVRLADTVVVVVVPGYGDDVQAVKAGLMEIADVFCVNKADLHGADKVAGEVEAMMMLSHPDTDEFWWQPIVRTIAERGDGVEELAKQIEAHREWSERTGEWRRRRALRVHAHVRDLLADAMVTFVFDERGRPRAEHAGLFAELERGAAVPRDVAARLLASFCMDR
jgi:LAO/AO transport system kinase